MGGITWIGHLYFFNFVNVPLQGALDDAAKKAIEMAIDDTNEVLSAQGLVVAAIQAGDFSVVSGAVEVPDTPDR